MPQTCRFVDSVIIQYHALYLHPPRLQDEFISVIGHELRTPLNAVIKLSCAMSNNLGAPEYLSRHRLWIDTITRSAKHLLGIINDIITMKVCGDSPWCEWSSSMRKQRHGKRMQVSILEAVSLCALGCNPSSVRSHDRSRNQPEHACAHWGRCHLCPPASASCAASPAFIIFCAGCPQWHPPQAGAGLRGPRGRPRPAHAHTHGQARGRRGEDRGKDAAADCRGRASRHPGGCIPVTSGWSLCWRERLGLQNRHMPAWTLPATDRVLAVGLVVACSPQSHACFDVRMCTHAAGGHGPVHA